MSFSEKKSHPPALPFLFFTEMWERFSYYGMRAILALYAIKYLGFSDVEAGKLYGSYTGLVYITPLFGGLIADKYLGFRRSILMGSLIMGAGHLVLAVDHLYAFYSGLVLLVIGNGFFKPNMSGLVGSLYENAPEKRDSGFTIFYMGINLGGFIGPIVCGYLAEEVSWHYGFGAAGVGMGIGFLVFLWGQRYIPEHLGNPPMGRDEFQILPQSIKLTQKEINRIQAIFIFSFFSIFFWTAFEQAGSSMNIFADRYVDRWILGWELPASIFQSVNPIFILLFAPLFAKLWSTLQSKNREPDSTVKFSLGLMLLSLGFFCMVLAGKKLDEPEKVSMIYLILAYLFNTWGELCLSPVGLSMVARLSPSGWNGFLMGVWLMSNAISHMLGGFLSGYMENLGIDEFFSIFVALGLLAGFSLFFMRSYLQKKIKS